MTTLTIDKLDPNFAKPDPQGDLLWYDILNLGLEGRGWSDTLTPYDRLPHRAREVVREPVWNLSLHSAGMSVRFVTDAKSISARWSLRSPNLAMNHMPATGVSGLDLYAREPHRWRWAGIGIPAAQEASCQLLAGMDGQATEFQLFLPLYNGVTRVEIGVPKEATLSKAPARQGNQARGFVVYGTSIVHGGCASRPGMAYPAIMARAMDCNHVNLGFSGNGPMDLEIVQFLGELDPAVFVLDGLPNMTPETVTERAVPFVRHLRQLRPATPIVLVENIIYQRSPLDRNREYAWQEKNRRLKQAYQQLLDQGVPGLTYVPADHLLGDDTEGTVDGTHPTDVGFARMAQVIGAAVAPLL